MSLLIAVVDETRQVAPRDLRRLQRAAQANANDCARIWSREPPTVVVFDTAQGLPKGVQVSPVAIIEGGLPEGNMAEHYSDPAFGPVGRVDLSQSGDTFGGDHSVCENLCHEVVEIICDPKVNLWAEGPPPGTVPGWTQLENTWQWAVECADPVQTTYDVKLWGLTGSTTAAVANFVTPAWFDVVMLRSAAACEDWRERMDGFDFAKQLTHPFEVRPEGYAIARPREGSGSARRVGTWKVARPPHPWSRTARRGGM